MAASTFTVGAGSGERTLTYFAVTTPEPMFPVWMYGARPLSLDMSMTERELGPNELGQPKRRYFLDCPTANSSSSRTPEEEDADGQCRLADLFPAEAYSSREELDLTVFGGTFTPGSAPEKTWRCEVTAEFGSSGNDETLVGGDCSQWESAPAGGADAPITTTTATVDRCQATRQWVPMRLTAGYLGDVDPDASYWWNPTVVNNEQMSALSSQGCPNPTSLVGFAAATATATSGSSATGPAALVCAVLACASLAGLLRV